MKKQKGITLVALVITIIILLILASITIGALTKSNLFGRAKQAKSKTEEAQKLENTRLADYDLVFEEIGTGTQEQEDIDYEISGFVQYDAGTWTQDEITALGSLYNENTNLESNADTKETFGGFKAGDSRNDSISSKDDRGNTVTPEYGGWKVFGTTTQGGKTYVKSLIHAGSPENFTFYISYFI